MNSFCSVILFEIGRGRGDIQAVGWKDMDWFVLAQDRDKWRELVNAVMNDRVP
jgi:hypothetical protein